MITVQVALIAANKKLIENDIPDAARDARRLMAHALGIKAERISLHMSDPLDDAARATFDACVAKRAAGQPLSHLVGGRLFYDRWFAVTPDVLDPRPETETLVQAALSQSFESVIDLGTGSGAILLTLLAENTRARGLGTDASQPALDVAKRNAAALGVSERAEFACGDWFDVVSGQCDLIVSNPPYIALDEMEGLQRDVREYEPWMALTDGADGLQAYRIIVQHAPAHLHPGGRLLVEIGPTQAAAVCAMMETAGLCDIAVIPDMDGRDRVVAGVKSQNSRE